MHYAFVLLVAFATTLVTTPIVRKLAIRAGAVVQPGPAASRHVHTRPTPTLGGIAMFIGFLAAMATATRFHQFDRVFHGNTEPLGVILGAGVMLVVGLLDDLHDVSPPAKVAGMVVAASVMARFGVQMFFFRVPFNLGNLETVVLSSDYGPLVTVLWVVLMANAINLIDGLDGLAAGIVLIASTAFYLFARELYFHQGLDSNNVAPLIAIIAIGICAGFLPWNWTPAKIFMGDSGALFLGLLMAVPTITVGGRTVKPFYGNNFFFFTPMLVPLIILGVPVADTVFSFVRRMIAGRGFSHADRKHVHHRLVEMGHGPRRAVFILWAWTALLSGAALLPIYTDRGGALLPVAGAALLLMLYILFHPGVRVARARRGLARHPSRSGKTEIETLGSDAHREVDSVIETRGRTER